MDAMNREQRPIIGDSKYHQSAWGQVTGIAEYVDDMREPQGLLNIYIAYSPHAHARILSMDLSAVAAYDGIATVVSAQDILGHNDISCIHRDDEPVLAHDLVQYVGQPIFAVAAESVDAARRAAKLAKIEYEILKPILTIEDAMAAENFVLPPKMARRGNPEKVLKTATHRLQGELLVGGQDHFYLESQISMAWPLDDGGMKVFSATQNPSEVQYHCAQVLGLPNNAVEVVVRRMGGGFGGKETQPAQYAAIACLVAHKSGRPAKVRLDRDDDMVMTGKRHDFKIEYDVGFDDTGRIQAISFVQKVKCGFAADLSGAVADRGIMHADNAYFLEHVEIHSYRCKTNTVSNTAFRGFGVPQGVIGIERALLDIAHHLGLDPLEVRKANLYHEAGRDITHYGQRVTNLIIGDVMDKLVEDSSYNQRRENIAEYNQNSKVFKRGIAVVPCMMGICFTRDHLNQAGALIHIYKDGSVAVNHGGTEMGQGLHVKIAQIAANELGVKFERVIVAATTTDKVPNSSPTASSAGIDLNGMAVIDAVRTLKERLTNFAAAHYNVEAETVSFDNGLVHVGPQIVTFDELVMKAYLARVSLSATGYFKTPHVYFDDQNFVGQPFLYFCFGAAVSEVVIDTLTGEYRVERVDILHDVGTSLNVAIDIGQIEGGFIQGMGWLTTEELWWNAKGELKTHAPSTYKIPASSDVPPVFNVSLVDNKSFRAETPYWSKAVGEPPLILAVSVHQALIEAVTAARKSGDRAGLDAPATPERVLMATVARKSGNRAGLDAPATPERVLMATV